MSDFLIRYRLGEGEKTRELTIQGVSSRKEASVKFIENAPENAYITAIDELDPSAARSSQNHRSHRKMAINNSFDAFILKSLEEADKTNQELIDFISINRKQWKERRTNPESLKLSELMMISAYLEIPFEDLVNEAHTIAKEKMTSS